MVSGPICYALLTYLIANCMVCPLTWYLIEHLYGYTSSDTACWWYLTLPEYTRDKGKVAMPVSVEALFINSLMSWNARGTTSRSLSHLPSFPFFSPWNVYTSLLYISLLHYLMSSIIARGFTLIATYIPLFASKTCKTRDNTPLYLFKYPETSQRQNL
jgi:hypothetical protein